MNPNSVQTPERHMKASPSYRAVLYPAAAAIFSAKSTRWWLGIILITYLIGFISQWTRKAEGFVPTFTHTTAFGLDSASAIYGFISLLAATGHFRTNSIALTLGRRPHRAVLFFREVIGITAVITALHLVLSLVFTVVSAILFTVSSKPTPTGGDFGTVAKTLLLQWAVAFFMCVIATSLGFVFRSAAIATTTYLLILLIVPIAAGALIVFNESLGNFVLKYSLLAVIDSFTQQDSSISLTIVVAAIAWVAIPAVLAIFSFRRYTP